MIRARDQADQIGIDELSQLSTQLLRRHRDRRPTLYRTPQLQYPHDRARCPLLWRFSDAGPTLTAPRAPGPAYANLHNSGT